MPKERFQNKTNCLRRGTKNIAAHAHHERTSIESRDARYELCVATKKNSSSNIVETKQEPPSCSYNESEARKPFPHVPGVVQSQFLTPNPTFYPGMNFVPQPVAYMPFQPSFASYPYPVPTPYNTSSNHNQLFVNQQPIAPTITPSPVPNFGNQEKTSVEELREIMNKMKEEFRKVNEKLTRDP